MSAWWKGKIAEGSTCDDLIEFSDFLPTIVEAGRAKLPGDRVIDSRSFLARLTGDPYTARDSIFVHSTNDRRDRGSDIHATTDRDVMMLCNVGSIIPFTSTDVRV